MNELKEKNQMLSVECKALTTALEGTMICSALLFVIVTATLFSFHLGFYPGLFLGCIFGLTYYGWTKISVYLYLISKIKKEVKPENEEVSC